MSQFTRFLSVLRSLSLIGHLFLVLHGTSVGLDIGNHCYMYSYNIMNHALKLRQVGNSLGVILPKEVIGQLNVREGDTLYLTQGSDGYRVVANDPNFERAMELYREGANRYRNALKKLSE